MKLFVKIILAFIVCQNILTALSQDVGFSQFYNQPLLRNPALAGIFTGDMRFTASYRNQWQSVTVPYRTFGISSEVKLPVYFINDANLTLGLQLERDIAGTSEFSTTQMLPAANLSVPFIKENSFLSFALMGGLVQQRFDPTKLVLNDQFIEGSNGSFTILPSSRQVFNKTDLHYLDMSFGLSANGTIGTDIDYFVGVGVFHFLKPRVAFFERQEVALNKKIAANLGTYIPLNGDDDLVLYGDFFKQAKVKTFQAGMMYSHDLFVDDNENVYKGITAGILYRLDDAIIPVIEMHLSKFTVGLSYDVNVSKLSMASQYRGGLEVTLSYKDLFNYNKGQERQRKCPSFGGHMPREHFIGY